MTMPLVGQRLRWQPLNEPGVGGALTSIAISPHEPERVLAAGDMLGAALSLDGGRTWGVTTGFISWELADFTFHPTDPREVWVGTMSGPHVSRDGGRTWTVARNGMPAISGGSYSVPIQKVLFDGADAKRMLAFGGSHRQWSSPGRPMWGVIWESEDGGESWQLLTTIGDGANLTSAVQLGETLYVTAIGIGVFRSGDRGKSWEACGAGLPHGRVKQVAVHPGDANVLWVALDNVRGVPGSIYKSVDGCASWVDSGRGLTRAVNNDVNLMSRYGAIAVSPTDPNRLYTAERSFSLAALWRSDDGGDSWRQILNYGTRGRWPMPFNNGPTADWITVHPTDAEQVFFANQANIIFTPDGGGTFEDRGARLVSAEAKQWKGRGFSGLVAVNFRFNPVRPGHAVFNAMDDGKVWTSDDDLESWWYAGPGVPAYGGGNDSAFAGGAIYTSFGQDGSFQGLAKSVDGGKNWTMLFGPERGLPARGAANQRARGVYAMQDDAARAWAVIGDQVYATTDGGMSWTVVLKQAGLAWLAGVGQTVYASATNGVYVASDGMNFVLMDGSPREGWRMTIDPADASVLYVTKWRKSAGGLWRYQAGEWTRLHADAFVYDVAVDPFDSRRIVFCTNDDPYHDASFATGVYLSEDGGATWSAQNEGLAMLRVSVVRFDPHKAGRLVVGTGGRGYFVGQWVEGQ